jgi:DNA topoisomerase I
MKESSATPNLVIVESPAKAKTIEKFLGKDFQVVSCFGHIRDLEKKNFGINKENNYEPQYVVSTEKKKVVTELKKSAKSASVVWLASDEDREGEAIAWHLAEVLKLKPENTRRIVFDEITKNAILHAVKNHRQIDQNLVNAQQARRILDRLVGFELSPILWRKVKPSLSAGRVQSVAVRLLVEREREIIGFKSTPSYKVSALFNVTDDNNKDVELKAELSTRIKSKTQVLEFLEKCKEATYKVADVVTKPAKKSPAAPFTTSTLQQEASRKLGFSVAQTMRVAQKLYEAGRITYMRTDSVHLSDLALNTAREEITKEYGAEYAQTRRFRTKSKGAQEAHEAIRPTFMGTHDVPGSQQEKKLYNLIWKRTLASQMSEAQLEKTTITINISTTKERFQAKGEVILFEGFLKVYLESTDKEEDSDDATKGLLPPMHAGHSLDPVHIEAVERFSQRPARYTEASLVKKLEELGIGRPSTYAPTISTVQQRGYVVKEERPGIERNYHYLCLKGTTIKEEMKTEITGAEKNKLFPTDIGMVVNDFLVKHFEEILAYNFTANVEKEFDDIAEGKMIWYKMIDEFYKPFHQKVVDTTENSERHSGERLLGVDSKSGKNVYVRIGRYGPMAQIGQSIVEGTDDPNVEKPKFAKLGNNQRLETITLEEALVLFELPRIIGQYEDEDMVAAIGRFGPYVRHKSKFYSIKKGVADPYTIQTEQAIELIEEKREADRNKVINIFEGEDDVQVLNGRWGPYIAYQKTNYKIPKTTDPKSLTLEDCMTIIEKGPSKRRPPKAKAKTTAKTTTKTKAKAKTKAKKK